MMNRKELINDLKSRSEKVIGEAEVFAGLSDEDLNYRAHPSSWSILECLEHLNLYGDFYIPEIGSRIDKASPSENESFSSGWLGNYFAEMMLPPNKGALKKMKTFKSMNPIHKKLDRKVLVVFLDQQKRLLNLLENAKQVDLGKTKTGISISRWIKLKLGDTFRVVIYHNQRHVKQACNVLPELQPQ